MNVQKDIPARVNAWLAQTRKADGASQDRDARPDFVQFEGPPSFEEDRIVSARAQFDSRGTVQADLMVDAHEHPFYSNELTIRVRRQGDLEQVSVRSHHPRDPEMFDYRASYARNVQSGEVQNFELRQGPPHGMELAREIFSNRECQINLAGGAVLGTFSGAVTALTSGFHPGAGAVAGLVLGTLGGYAFSASRRAYGG
ncbi:hypothetical protein ABS71_10830 [bacterium SCN 62-11]|nr:hypothetical protein [Candidatus Eremiobacteraeota bacterium]ODT67468.1 MAG: hypothetical protein ABS71_10830 [bacterium SCN 62-11]